MILRTRSKTVAKQTPPWRSACSEQANRAQYSVNELGRVLAAKLLGQFHSLINGGSHRHPIIEEYFVDGKPQDIAVDRRHLVERPGGRRLRDDLVDPLLVVQHALDQLAGEALRLLGDVHLVAKAPQRVAGSMADGVELVEGLEGDHAGAVAFSCHDYMPRPPSTASTCPVTYEASSEA